MSDGRSLFGLIGAAGYAPIPTGHGFSAGDRVFGSLGIDDGDSTAPFEVTDQGATKFGVGGHTYLVGGVEEKLHPSFTFRFVEHFPDVVGDHDGVATTVVSCVICGAPEDFAYEVCDMTGMIRGHIFEDGADQVVFENFLVEDLKEVLQDGFASGPLI
jgi:hypothetical protein